MWKRRLFIAALPLLLVSAASAAETALDRYIKAPDPSYRYDVINTVHGEGYTFYAVDLTSQTWRKPEEVNRTVWKHWLTIVKPDQVTSTTGYLFITGGSVGRKAPDAANAAYVELAMSTHTVVAELQDIPNEPLQFTEDGRMRSEDGIIAFTWMKYLKTGDETWPLRLPMTKAAVRAMDTASAVAKVEKFVVAGGSKRGWTTWTTAAVDKRVVAIVPAVIDLLNIEKSFEHHYKVYGFWAPAIKDYEEAGVMDWTGTPEYAKLMQIEEPYNYRDRLTMPKFIVNDTGDQFFVPDSSQFYFDDLKGEKYLRYVPNTDHSLRNSDARDSMAAFYQAFVEGKPRPDFKWSFEKNGDIRVVSKTKPAAVKLWQATNAEHRDFRLMTIGPAYRSIDLQDQGGGVYVGHVPAPEKGWTAYFVEMTYPGPGKYPFKFTSGVRVAPDTEPFPAYAPKRPAK
jgi:PhoPQ-activated pathogenicity-related protein